MPVPLLQNAKSSALGQPLTFRASHAKQGFESERRSFTHRRTAHNTSNHIIAASAAFSRLRNAMSLQNPRGQKTDLQLMEAKFTPRKLCAVHRVHHTPDSEIFFPCLKLRWIPKVVSPKVAEVSSSTAIVPFVPAQPKSSSQCSSTSPQEPMANFPMDPLAYVPRGGVLLDGGGELRKARNFVSLAGQHIRLNEDLAIANCDLNLTALERHEFLMLIHHHLTQVLRLQVLRYGVYPFGLGFFKMGTLFQRDSIVNNGPHWIDGFPADEDELPQNGGNPHPFNGEVFPGEPNWVQQWANDQMLHAGFHNENMVEQPNPGQEHMVNPDEDLPQWEQWPNQNNEAQQVAPQQEEVSMEVSGLSVGFTSGSTAASGSNTSGPAAPQNTVTGIPRALSPSIIPRPAIRLVYSRRQRNTTSDNLNIDLSASATQSGSQKKIDKGKGIMLPGLPSIHDLESASKDDQVGLNELTAQAGTSTQLVPVRTKVTEDEEHAE
ncbi:hypothetical protein GUJ93_ZPchr0012g21564 [Zizania palustris]|uniref:DUF7597 domain-containing protein n=1 Tax=Zizania palustris TaxID=103762 RepID=A0A8J6BUV4_ZIZPA|nr:hypothetical protein GUJ93_ZPchr0012g21564 [Zizania palustris]